MLKNSLLPPPDTFYCSECQNSALRFSVAEYLWSESLGPTSRFRASQLYPLALSVDVPCSILITYSIVKRLSGLRVLSTGCQEVLSDGKRKPEWLRYVLL